MTVFGKALIAFRMVLLLTIRNQNSHNNIHCQEYIHVPLHDRNITWCAHLLLLNSICHMTVSSRQTIMKNDID